MKRTLVLFTVFVLVSFGAVVADAHAHGGWRFGIYTGFPAYYPPPPAYYYAPPPPVYPAPAYYYAPPPVPYYYAPPPRAFVGFAF